MSFVIGSVSCSCPGSSSKPSRPAASDSSGPVRIEDERRLLFPRVEHLAERVRQPDDRGLHDDGGLTGGFHVACGHRGAGSLVRREDVLELRPIDERFVEMRILACRVAEDVFDARGNELLGEVFAARAGERRMASGETGAPGACAIAVTDSRIELAAAVVTPVATRRRTKSRREMPLVRSCATRFLMTLPHT